MRLSRRRNRSLVGALGILLLTAGVAYAASTTFTAPMKVAGGQRTVTAACTVVTVGYTPTYSPTDGTYGTDQVSLGVTCPGGDYHASVAFGTGGSTYVEKVLPFSLPGPTATAFPLTLPSRVKAADLTNVAGYVAAD